MAFKGMNPEIERMMEDERLREEEAEALKKETDVNDADMAAFHGDLNETVAKKFATKRKLDDSSKESGEDLLKKGSDMLNQAQSHNKVWKKQKQDHKRGNKRKFMKPQE